MITKDSIGYDLNPPTKQQEFWTTAKMLSKIFGLNYLVFEDMFIRLLLSD